MAGIYIFIIVIMRVLQSLYSKKAALVLPSGIQPYISYVAISNLFSTCFALIFIIGSANFKGINMQSIIIASCSGISLAVGSVCNIKSLIGGTIALNSIFGTAGMIIPIILSAFLFDEPVSLIQVICIVVLFISLFVIVSSTKNIMQGFSMKTLIYLIGSFLSNGIVMFYQNLFGHLQPDGNVSMFSMLTFLIPTIVMGILLLFMKIGQKESNKAPTLPKNLFLYAAILAFAVFIIQQFVTILTPVMSSVVLFTLVNGCATIIAAIVGVVVYKEKITLKSGLGIILGLIALILIKLGN